jgi:hypothetical protein
VRQCRAPSPDGQINSRLLPFDLPPPFPGIGVREVGKSRSSTFAVKRLDQACDGIDVDGRQAAKESS